MSHPFDGLTAAERRRWATNMVDIERRARARAMELDRRRARDLEQVEFWRESFQRVLDGVSDLMHGEAEPTRDDIRRMVDGWIQEMESDMRHPAAETAGEESENGH